jgi:hypothetical protein
VAVFNVRDHVGFGAVALCISSNVLCTVVSVLKSGTIKCMLIRPPKKP